MSESYYQVIDGIKYKRKLIELAEQAVAGAGDGRVSVADAKLLYDAMVDGMEITETEERTLQYLKEHFHFTPAALDWLQEALAAWDGKRPTAPEPAGHSYYRVMDGHKYDRHMLDLAEQAVAGKGDGRISVEDAKGLYQAIIDGHKITQHEQETLEYIKANFHFTQAALHWLDGELARWNLRHDPYLVQANQEMLKEIEERALAAEQALALALQEKNAALAAQEQAEQKAQQANQAARETSPEETRLKAELEQAQAEATQARQARDAAQAQAAQEAEQKNQAQRDLERLQGQQQANQAANPNLQAALAQAQTQAQAAERARDQAAQAQAAAEREKDRSQQEARRLAQELSQMRQSMEEAQRQATKASQPPAPASSGAGLWKALTLVCLLAALGAFFAGRSQAPAPPAPEMSPQFLTLQAELQKARTEAGQSRAQTESLQQAVSNLQAQLLEAKNSPPPQTIVKEVQNQEKAKLVQRLKQTFAAEIRSGWLQLDEELLRLDFASPEPWFLVGDHRIKKEWRDKLAGVLPPLVKSLQASPLKITQIRIEGHSSPDWKLAKTPRDAYIGNMALSAQRALSVLQFIYGLEQLSPSQDWLRHRLSATGLADALSLPEAAPAENQELRRRISFSIEWEK